MFFGDFVAFKKEKEVHLPIAAVERLIKAGGADRVGRDAALELIDVLEEYAIIISQRAVQFAKHAGRKTVTDKDIKMARLG